jgi:DNA-binding Xre family transcriptional regulator
MKKKMGYTWHLVPLLAERGISLSREQVFRLVTQEPQRLSMDTLAALCDILECTPNDLIEPTVVNVQVPKVVGDDVPDGPLPSAPRRTVVRRPDQR